MPLPSTIETRLYAEQVPEWQRFQANPKGGGDGAQHPYQRQYAHVYHQRLAQIGPRIWKRLKEEEDSITHVQRILELPEDQRCACVGTLVVERALKISTTSALEEADDEDALISSLNNTSPKNDASYYLEDESGRVALNLTSYWNKSSTTTEAIDFCTGLVLGLIGIVGGADGVLTVERVVPAASVQTIPPPAIHATTSVRAPQVLLLSGLECGSPHASSLPRDMLLSYLQGLFPHADSQASAIVHIIIAGGLVYHPTTEGEDVTTTTANGCRDLDAFLYQLTRITGIPVSILPGQKDPTTANWPQRPLHPALLPVAASNPSLLSRCPNPYAATLVWNDDERRTICGTDGLNVADFMQQTNADALSALQATLMHAHMCPTGPSSVPTAPHTETDPMVLPSPPPHVYFAGNCPRLQTRLVQTDEKDTPPCRLVCLPKFIDTGLAVLVHLPSLQVEALRFAI